MTIKEAKQKNRREREAKKQHHKTGDNSKGQLNA